MKKILYEQLAQIAQAVGHPLRIAILDYLKDGPRCVCEIAAAIGSERTNVSRHLSVLQAAGILNSQKKGLNVIYAIQTPCILEFLDKLGECLHQKAAQQIKMLDEIIKPSEF